MPLPTFIVVGAMKAGTTSLHYYLSLHPEIGMSEVKELDFFCAEKSWDKGVDWYRAQFPEGYPARGEASPGYTKHPRFAGVPVRMHSVVPDAKLIYLVRDPIARIVSHYLDQYHWGFEHRSFEKALEDLDDNHYVNCSRYHMQVEQYRDLYPRSSFLVVSSEDMRARREETLRTIYRHIGVDEGFVSPETERELWTAEEKTRATRIGYLLTRASRAVGRTRLRRYLPYGLARAVNRFNRATERPVPAPVLSDALRARLRERLQDDTDRFRKWAGLELSEWSV